MSKLDKSKDLSDSQFENNSDICAYFQSRNCTSILKVCAGSISRTQKNQGNYRSIIINGKKCHSSESILL